MKKTRSISRNANRNRLIEGVLRGNKKGFAFLLRKDKGADLFIPHTELKGAQHGDTVLAKIIRGDQAQVVKILERGVTRLTGTIAKNPQGYVLIADDQCYYSAVGLYERPRQKVGEKVMAEIVDYEKGRYPMAKIIRGLGVGGSEEAEILSCLYANGFADVFPKKVEKEAEFLQTVSLDNRLDLRDMLTITIDGEDARDFDDAISVQTEGEQFVLWVHIADVSAYVTPGDIIDHEAYKRGTSVYFPKQAYPMLPEKLCNNLCSLREGEDKATLSVKMCFDKYGERISSNAYLSYIRSNHRMTYTEVQAIFDGESLEKYKDTEAMLATARKLASALSDIRYKRGSIDFASAETKVEFDNESISRVVPVMAAESNRLIEEFMIAANEAVAEMLTQADYPCAYRVHDIPDPKSLKQLTLFASCFMEVPEKRYLKPEEICEFMRRCMGTEEGAIVSSVAIKCMKKAEYSPENIGHYGLASECYCHFTSPIRRYPDLIVHRLLKRLIENKPFDNLKQAKTELAEICTQCSVRERAAEHAERDIISYYQAVYMLEHLQESFSGVISGVTAYSVFVTMENGIEGSIRTDTIEDSFYFDEMRLSLVSERVTYRMGDLVNVIAVASDVASRRVTLEFADKIPPTKKCVDGVGEI